jgi:hypothetical protein
MNPLASRTHAGTGSLTPKRQIANLPSSNAKFNRRSLDNFILLNKLLKHARVIRADYQKPARNSSGLPSTWLSVT